MLECAARRNHIGEKNSRAPLGFTIRGEATARGAAPIGHALVAEFPRPRDVPRRACAKRERRRRGWGRICASGAIGRMSVFKVRRDSYANLARRPTGDRAFADFSAGVRLEKV